MKTLIRICFCLFAMSVTAAETKWHFITSAKNHIETIARVGFTDAAPDLATCEAHAKEYRETKRLKGLTVFYYPTVYESKLNVAYAMVEIDETGKITESWIKPEFLKEYNFRPSR